jgi:hypothetical protein
MSRATVRAAIAAYFAPPAVVGLNRVYTSMPKRVEGPNFRDMQPAGTYSGAVAIINIESESETRRSIGGEHSGWKRVSYTVALDIYSHSIHRRSEDAMADFDTVIDGVKAHLRSNRRLEDYPQIFEAGEIFLDGDYGEPKVLQDGSTEIWGTVRFEVSEFIQT